MASVGECTKGAESLNFDKITYVTFIVLQHSSNKWLLYLGNQFVFIPNSTLPKEATEQPEPKQGNSSNIGYEVTKLLFIFH